VLCREIVLSASPSYFRPGRESMGGVFVPDRVKAWTVAALAWAKRQWPDQLASFVVHTDEQNIHAHLLVVPRVKSATGAWKLNSKALFDRERLRELQTGYGEALAPLGIRRGEPGSQATHTEVRQFYGAIHAIKSLPERVKLPPAPKVPKPPSGIAAEVADALGSALGIETAHQREIKAHVEAMKKWRESVKVLREQDAKAWEIMKTRAAAAPLLQRRHPHEETTEVTSTTPPFHDQKRPQFRG
jgi:Plasmid recombination enzyme